jgi:snurportin-1
MSELIPSPEGSTSQSTTHLEFKFPHPTTFITIPYHSDMSLHNLLHNIIPLARSSRVLTITADPAYVPNGSMDIDVGLTTSVEVQSEGLLLYVSQATYEPGQSPLSSWIPVSYDNVNILDLFQRSVVSTLITRRPTKSQQVQARQQAIGTRVF